MRLNKYHCGINDQSRLPPLNPTQHLNQEHQYRPSQGWDNKAFVRGKKSLTNLLICPKGIGTTFIFFIITFKISATIALVMEEPRVDYPHMETHTERDWNPKLLDKSMLEELANTLTNSEPASATILFEAQLSAHVQETKNGMASFTSGCQCI
ncbi:hypothetical protein PoB_002470500 [Plakobranchus ocellatus]|uniref:Uncharacterized protein n=1 Tax=Plakobranchus ocellatus TaxID=259542 RepID=A0AAV3ZU72_9GAST|nr:hypothetical protein PoB_002470500 [Plakobranchus ocellatus]